MKYFCSICGLAEADTIAALEGFTGVVRARPVCWPCCSPVPDPPEEYEPVDLDQRRASKVRGELMKLGSRSGATLAVYEAVRRLGEATTEQIAELLGIAVPRVGTTREERRPYDALGSCLRRAVARGELTGEWRMPGAPTAGRIYRYPRKETRSA